MQFVSSLMWGITEYIGIHVILKRYKQRKIEDFEDRKVETLQTRIRIWHGILILIAVICGWRTMQITQSVFDCIKVLITYVIFSLAMMVDQESFIIPNDFIKIILIARILLIIPELLFYREYLLASILGSIVGGIVSLVILLTISVVAKGGFGMGDVKLLAAEGFMLGLYSVINTLLYGLVWCAMYALMLLATKKKGLKDRIAFGPFLFAGLVVSILIGGF